ncbi:hypothetical protein [Saccharothrix texasensis]|uniref:Uncharacterized protein n=1 Tax=Saccharothrix texasensis TaxID=103734 RepID=A0A3N1GY88_9PSEU|nr:hypothetical protein [Saccharothrix texasensis]ROP34982.1 hypothetical protein EDD40_0195 [Saccharothrix texasensis]
MRTPPRTGLPGLRRYAIPLLVASLAVLAVPAQAVAGPPRTAVEEPEYPPTPGPAPLADTHPALLTITQDAELALRYTYSAVASDPTATYPEGSIEADLRTGLLSLPADRLRPIVDTARTLVASPAETRIEQFGRHGRLPVEEFRRLGFDGAFADVRYDRESLNRTILARAAELEREGWVDDEAAARSALPKLTSLDLRVDKVKCVDETSDWWFEDEIAMGGVAVDHTGKATKVNRWFVGDFDQGDSVNYADPGKLFRRFDLTAAGAWPRSFVATVMLAEEDEGDFAAAIQQAWAKVSAKVQAEIAKAVASATAPYVGAAIAEAIGQVVGWLADKFATWLMGLLDDELFKAGTAFVKLPHRLQPFYVNPQNLGWTNHRLPPTTMTFIGHDGQYKVNLHWQVNL